MATSDARTHFLFHSRLFLKITSVANTSSEIFFRPYLDNPCASDVAGSLGTCRSSLDRFRGTDVDGGDALFLRGFFSSSLFLEPSGSYHLRFTGVVVHAPRSGTLNFRNRVEYRSIQIDHDRSTWWEECGIFSLHMRPYVRSFVLVPS